MTPSPTIAMILSREMISSLKTAVVREKNKKNLNKKLIGISQSKNESY
jgi:hypothetical protein